MLNLFLKLTIVSDIQKLRNKRIFINGNHIYEYITSIFLFLDCIGKHMIILHLDNSCNIQELFSWVFPHIICTLNIAQNSQSKRYCYTSDLCCWRLWSESCILYTVVASIEFCKRDFIGLKAKSVKLSRLRQKLVI